MDLQKLAPKPGKTLAVTITRTPSRESARKTLERLFLSDGEFRAPIDARSAGHTDRPKRRGGRIYTKYTRKVHPELIKGVTANIRATPQHVRDLQSVASFVDVK